MEKAVKKRLKVSPGILIILGFAAVILLGTGLLMLPVSSRDGGSAPFGDALFTAVSAVCVTGLVVRDTATSWSGFGQAILLLLIQIGGLGVVTVAAAVVMLSGRKISLFARSTMQSAISAPQIGGIVRLTRFVLLGTLIIELTGALALLPSFIPTYGAKGIWFSVFHSISAFCNAGFDIMGGTSGQFSSLTAFYNNAAVTVPIMLLIIIGGIGFLTWNDVVKHRFRLNRYSLQSKAALTVSGLLILIPAVWFFFIDQRGLPFGERLLTALFQAVTPRTAGFNTIDLNLLSAPSKGVMTGLMLIGGSPGSTAGGMKTTTFVLLIVNVVAVFRNKDDAELFGRRVQSSTVRTAGAIFMMYLTLFVSSAAVISLIEGLPIGTCLFETASAIGTVGLTLGITPTLGTASRCILMFLMFMGRIGGLTFVYAFLSRSGRVNSKLPMENIIVG